MKTDFELLYEHKLKIQKTQRLKAGALIEAKEFNKAWQDTHYCNVERKHIDIEDMEIDKLAEKLLEIKSTLPQNAGFARLSCHFNEEKDEYEFQVNWREHALHPETKCEGLAKSFTNSLLWKMKHQKGGKEAIAAEKLLETLRQEEA